MKSLNNVFKFYYGIEFAIKPIKMFQIYCCKVLNRYENKLVLQKNIFGPRHLFFNRPDR